MREENLFSEEYDDFYSSSKGALEECKHVFIDANDLTKRFKALKQNSTFIIGELGFGVGINFVATCSEWLKHSSDNQNLEFYSFDKYLFKVEDFKSSVLKDVNGRTTIIILGDARNNYGNPKSEILREIYERAQRVIWLNPESRSSWGVGDAEMPKYSPACHQTEVCNSLTHLERVVSNLLKYSR